MLLIEVAAQAKRKCRKQPVGDHHQHRAGQPDDVKAGDTQKDEAHVRHTRVTDQQVQILLPYSNQATKQEVGQGQPSQHLEPALRPDRCHRDRHADESVQTEFFQHPGVQHGGGRGCGTVTERCPCVERPK